MALSGSLLLPGHYLHANHLCGTWAVDFGWEKQKRRNEVQDGRAWSWAEVRTQGQVSVLNAASTPVSLSKLPSP